MKINNEMPASAKYQRQFLTTSTSWWQSNSFFFYQNLKSSFCCLNNLSSVDATIPKTAIINHCTMENSVLLRSARHSSVGSFSVHTTCNYIAAQSLTSEEQRGWGRVWHSTHLSSVLPNRVIHLPSIFWKNFFVFECEKWLKKRKCAIKSPFSVHFQDA